MIDKKKITLLDIQQKKIKRQPITMLTAYDYPSARLLDQAGIDMILVGDSLAMTVMGYANTLSVTMDEMIHHCKMVARGSEHAFLVGDMPFLSYQTSCHDAISNAGRFLKEGGMEAVKLEGGQSMTGVVRAIVDSGICVIGHIGLTPQSVTKLSGYRVQGKTAAAAQQLIDDALALQEAGCFALVLETIPAALAELITEKLSIPTIGIGAGKHCDGQVLVFHDLLGFYQHPVGKFVKQYANLNKTISEAVIHYCKDVEQRKFPADKHGFKIDGKELKKINR
jgi:3-methyl-2-oxobutanoate hydroxymethyltransferase